MYIKHLLYYFRISISDRALEPGKIGLIGRRGPDDKQAFMVGFFRRAQDLHVGSTRTARRVRRDTSSNSNEAENYYYWGGDSYCKYAKSDFFAIVTFFSYCRFTIYQLIHPVLQCRLNGLDLIFRL